MLWCSQIVCTHHYSLNTIIAFFYSVIEWSNFAVSVWSMACQATMLWFLSSMDIQRFTIIFSLFSEFSLVGSSTVTSWPLSGNFSPPGSKLQKVQLQKVSVTLWFRRLQCLVLHSVLSVLSTCVLQSECVHTMDFMSAHKQINYN